MKIIFLILLFLCLVNGQDLCLKTQIQRGASYGSLKGCYELKENSNETFFGLSLLNRPGLSFSNPYKDEFTDEDLYPALMDPISCTIHCGDYFFKYAALKNGNECYCGNDTIESSYNQINNTFCNKTCVGCLDYNCSTNDKCGGETVYTVYDVKIPDNKVPTDGGNIYIEEKLEIISNLKNRNNPRYEPRFLNCIKDSSDCYKRILNSTEVYETGVDTIDKCIKYCNSKGIFGYAGLEAGNQCFCGNDFTSKDINLDLEHCSCSCVGNRSQICGGFFALSVYNASKVDIKNEGDNSTGSSKTKKIIGITVGLVVGLIVIGVVIVYIRKWKVEGVEKPIVIERNMEEDGSIKRFCCK
ncbi:3128_t:CDS:1 [Diversispora eburnea]|uniref:3128_t:CDS:1 n=1 Tax=Diversispora eburnea TaxID=1213867 RepID=A0A9N9C0M7_9GLOM|nr:3128_t:CDS:1 [Diversispora eburnea]